MRSDRPTGRYRRKSDALPPADKADPAAALSELYSRQVGTVHAWFHRRPEWVASDVTVIQASARERMGLPLDLATEDGYVEVENRLSPCVALERQSAPPSRARARGRDPARARHHSAAPPASLVITR